MRVKGKEGEKMSCLIHIGQSKLDVYNYKYLSRKTEE